MYKRVVLILSTLFLAFGILFTSFLKSAKVDYVFGATSTPTPTQTSEAEVLVNYTLSFPGPILPDSPLWYIKVARDKVWLLLTTNPGKKAQLLLLFADKRLSSSRTLFEREKAELAYSTLEKAEKYLEEASIQEYKNRQKGIDTSAFLEKLANAALKHRQVIEEILLISPEDAKPQIIKVQDYSRNVYKEARDALNAKGREAPKNPFNGE